MIGPGLMHPERTCPCDDDFLPGLRDKEECSQLATEQLPGDACSAEHANMDFEEILIAFFLLPIP